MLPYHLSSAVQNSDLDFVTGALTDGLVAGSLLLTRHPLGFLDVVAADTFGATRTGRRSTAIHIWHPRFTYPELDPPSCHSHGWSLTSAVLCGGLSDTRYATQARANGSHVAYSVRYAPANSSVDATRLRFDVMALAQHLFQAGDVYSMLADEFHDTHDSNYITITALIRGELSSSAVALYSEPDRKMRTYQRNPIPPDQAKLAISDIVAALKGG
jgi:hypothetical protein